MELPERTPLFLGENNKSATPKRQLVDSEKNGEENNSRNRTKSSSERVVGTLDSINADDDDDTDDFESDTGELPSSLNEEDEEDIFFSQLNQTVKRDFVYVLRSSFRSTTIIYIIGILLRIIDVSKTTFSKMILTLIAMGLLVTYLRIIFYKVKMMKSRKMKSE